LFYIQILVFVTIKTCCAVLIRHVLVIERRGQKIHEYVLLKVTLLL